MDQSSNYSCYYCPETFTTFKDVSDHLINKHPQEVFKFRQIKLCDKSGAIGYTTLNYNFRPIDVILAGKHIVCDDPQKVVIKDSKTIQTPSPKVIKRSKPTLSVYSSAHEISSDEDELATEMLDLSIQGLEPIAKDQATQVGDDLSELLSILPDAVSSLKDAGMYEDWLSYVRLLGDNTLPLNNIAHLLFLDVCRWYNCKNTVSMRYSKEIKQFWLLGYKIFHGKFLRFMAGFRHLGHVKGESSSKSLYNPIDTTINFAVPAMSVLSDTAKFKASDITPGVLGQMLDLFSQNDVKTYKLCVDGKKINTSSSQIDGEVNLFGFEDKPTFQDNKKRLQQEISLLKEIDDLLMNYQRQGKQYVSDLKGDYPLLKSKLKEVIQIASNSIQNLRKTKVKKNFALEKFKKLAGTDWSTSKFTFVLSAIQTSIFQLNEEVDTLLRVVNIVGHCLSYLNGCGDQYVNGQEVLEDKQKNWVCLSGIEQLVENVNERELFKFVRQRTDSWFAIRKQALVTGSTLNNAIGLGGLKSQKEHYSYVKQGKEKPEPNERVKMAMEHGSKNEINAISTLTGKILPSLFPGIQYFEEGCYALEHDDDVFCVVSPDGSGRLSDTQAATYAVEVKCPVPGKTFTTPVHYEIPKYYIPQLLSEMVALNVHKTIFVSYTSESTTVFLVKHNEELWNVIWEEAKEVLTGDSKVPTKASANVKMISNKISEFQSNNIEFIGEFPSTTAIPCVHSKPKSIFEKHCFHESLNKNEESYPSIEAVRTLVNKCAVSLTSSHNITKPVASEILMFIVSDLDRFFKAEQSHALPVCYGLKGYSLKTETLRKMLFYVLDECYQRNMHVPVVSFDGQWYRLLVRDSKDRPLTKLQLQKDVFAESKKKTKTDILNYFAQVNVIQNNQSVDAIMETVDMEIFHGGVMIHNTEYNGRIFVVRRIFNGMTVRHTSSSLRCLLEKRAQKNENKDIDVLNDNELENEVNDVVYRTLSDESEHIDEEISSVIDDVNRLSSNELNLRAYNNSIPAMNERNLDDIEFGIENIEMDQTEEVMHVDQAEVSIIENNDIAMEEPTENIDNLEKNECLKKMTNELRTTSEKRQSLSVEECKIFFASASELAKLTKYELLQCIKAADYYLKTKGQNMKTWWPKHRIVNCLCALFGDGSEVAPRTSRKKNPKSLKHLCKQRISVTHSKAVLNIIYADSIYRERLQEWQGKNVFKDTVQVKDEEPIDSWYSTPAFENGKIFISILDTEHMLVNTRVKCCTSGMPKAGIRNTAWVEVAKNCKTNKAGLTLAHVQDLIDKQSCAFALATFSFKVQEAMASLGFGNEAMFCKLMREWYEAEDAPGLSQRTRFNRRMMLRSWLLSEVRFDTFPPPGSYIKDIPIVLYEGLLTSIERRLQMIQYVTTGAYNVRAVGSQDVENFFGEFADLDPKGTGVVRPDDVKTVIANACEIYSARMDANRCFTMRTSSARPYPVKELDEYREESPLIPCIDKKINEIELKDHEFDMPERRSLNPKRKRGDVQVQGMPARGAQPVRQHHRRDETKILAHKRSGIIDFE